MRERHFEGATGREVTPDGRRPIRFVIRDAVAGVVNLYPNLFPFGRAWTEWWTR